MSDITISPNNEFKSFFMWQKLFYPKQWEIIESLKDYWEVSFIAGNGTGKTRLLYWNLIGYALGIHPFQDGIGEPPLRIKVLVTDFEKGLNDVARENLFLSTNIAAGTKLNDGRVLTQDLTMLPMLPPSMVEKEWDKEDRTLYLKNGSKISFQTSEQKKKMHSGTNFDILACDEEPTYAAYDESKRGLRTAKGGGKIIHAFTPPFAEGQGPTWTKERLLDKFDDQQKTQINKDVYVVRACMRDNPSITEDYIRKWMEGKTQLEIQSQLYGNYPSWGDLVHPKFEDREWDPKTKTGHLLPEDWEIPFDDPDFIFEMAVDWHPSKACAAVWTCENIRDGNVYVWQELKPYEKDLTPDKISAIFREIEGFPAQRLKITRYIDPKNKDKSNLVKAGANAKDEFRQQGIRFLDGYNREAHTGVGIVNQYFDGDAQGKNPRIFIHPSCTTLIKALKNHYWKFYGDSGWKPDPKWSDFPICLRYILQTKKKQRRRKRLKGHYKRPIKPLCTYDKIKGNPYDSYFKGRR